MQIVSLHTRCRNAESWFKKILLRALFRMRCFQNDFRATLQAATYLKAYAGQPGAGPMLGLCWPMLGLCWPMLSHLGSYAGAMFGPSMLKRP